MKFLVFSDTHNYLNNVKNVINNFINDINAIIHLGDHDKDAKLLSEIYSNIDFYYIKGNNDYNLTTPESMIININNKKIIITHGHKQNVYWGYDSIYYWAQENLADAVFFGHTHKPFNSKLDNIYLFNPGSISMPRGIKNPTFGIFEVDDYGNMNGKIMNYLNEDNFVDFD